jgi:hypothetical protein
MNSIKKQKLQGYCDLSKLLKQTHLLTDPGEVVRKGKALGLFYGYILDDKYS